MHFPASIVTVFFAIAGVAVAHNVPRATPTASRCDAQVILDTCLSTTKAILATCGPNDYSCLCTQYGNVLTCYNNCPADQGRFAIEASKVANCNAASLLASTTTTTSKPSTTASSSAATTTTDSASNTVAAASSSTAKPSNAAAGMRGDQIVAVEVGGLVALLAMGLGTLM